MARRVFNVASRLHGLGSSAPSAKTAAVALHPGFSLLDRRHSTAAPTVGPARAPLLERQVLHLHGRDAFKYLQGMVTNDLASLGPSQSDAGRECSSLYTMFLNAQVRAGRQRVHEDS